MTLRKGAFTLVLLIPVALFAHTGPANLNFESGQPGQGPTGWFSSSSVSGVPFQAVLVNDGCAKGMQCALLNGAALPPGSWFGNLSQFIAADRYLSRRIRFRAAVRVEGANTRAQMWLRVDRVGGGSSAFNNMASRPITSGEWSYYTIDANVAPDSARIFFGAFISGSGRVWVDDVSFEIVGNLREDPVGQEVSWREFIDVLSVP